LCVFDCGRFLRADNFTVEKDRLDFAHVLIATSSLDVVKRVERLLVDGVIVDVQVIEEWGYDLGDDACLLVDDRVSEASLHGDEEICCDPEASHQVDKLVEDYANGLGLEPGPVLTNVQKDSSNLRPTEKPDLSDPEDHHILAPSAEGVDSDGDNLDHVAESVPSRQEVEGKAFVRSVGRKQEGAAMGLGYNRARSCPPGASHSVMSGPWSLEWLQDQGHREVGVIFSAKKKGECPWMGRHQATQKGSKKRKVDGLLSHSIHSLKRIARLPIQDRREVLHILQKNERRERKGGVARLTRKEGSRASNEASTSSASVNNDWKHWVALQGNAEKAADDILEVGKSLGVFVTGDKANMFSVLAKPAKGKPSTSQSLEGESVETEKGN
jgi:hypothetical protein